MLCQTDREQLALALLLLKDYKTRKVIYASEEYLETVKEIVQLVNRLDIEEEYSKMMIKWPKNFFKDNE